MKKRNVWVTLALAITLTAMVGCSSDPTADAAKTEKQNIETSAEAETDKKDKTIQNTEGEDSEKKSEVINEQTPAVKDEKPSVTDKKEETNETKNTADDKKEESSKPSKDTKPSTGNVNNNPSNQNNKPADKPANKPSSTPTPTPKPTPEVHTHNWVVTETIPHAEEGHWETKVIKEAWTEEVYGWVTRCGVCKLDMTNFSADEMGVHITSGCYGGYYTDYEVINTIPHEAETEDVWVVDKKAYTETKYGCSCGAAK